MLSVVESVAFAAEAGCGCLADRPREKGFRYVCATSTARALSDARRQATDKALNDLAETLKSADGKQPPGLAPGALQSYAVSNARQVDSCVTSVDDGFAFSVLLRVPDRLVSGDALATFGPPAGQVRTGGTTKMRLRLDRIRTVEDGSAGNTGWLFDVLVDGRPVLQLPRRDYTDAPPANAYVPAPGDSTSVREIDVPTDREVHIEVKGRRTLGNDTAQGIQVLDVRAPMTIPVRNAESERNGLFLFHLSVLPLQ